MNWEIWQKEMERKIDGKHNNKGKRHRGFMSRCDILQLKSLKDRKVNLTLNYWVSLFPG